jgi:hypothetical protein
VLLRKRLGELQRGMEEALLALRRKEAERDEVQERSEMLEQQSWHREQYQESMADRIEAASARKNFLEERLAGMDGDQGESLNNELRDLRQSISKMAS